MTNEAPKKFAFKKSALADKADKIWTESKQDFTTTNTLVSHIQLEKKTLGDVLGKISAQTHKGKDDSDKSSVEFVFGSKISDRIVPNESNKSQDNLDGESKTMSATELFKTAVKKDEEKNGTTNFRREAEQEAERVKEVEKQHASTSVVEVTTGEETDDVVFQASCKIWVFDKDKKEYMEKGVCTLRINKILNDGTAQHRIVARTSGTLRVVINSKIFRDMILERPDKRIRISAMGQDNSSVQIFLLKFGFSKSDTGVGADQFFSILSDLLNNEKSGKKRKADNDIESNSVKAKEAKEDTSDKEIRKNIEERCVMTEKSTEDAEEKVDEVSSA